MTDRATGIITSAVVIGLLLADMASLPAKASQRLFCDGEMNSGWRYSAEFRDGSFTQVRWSRSGAQSTVSNLTFSYTNNRGQPVYTGAFRANTLVTLVDLSRGNVSTGSRIAVQVEEWGRSIGTCDAPIPGAW